MLPVTRHKGFHIPHSLATLAAIVAVITATSWEASRDDAVMARSSSTVAAPVDAAQTAEEKSDEEAPHSVRTSAPSCKRTCERDSLSELLPLVLPSILPR